jgi:hypothetical protein
MVGPMPNNGRAYKRPVFGLDALAGFAPVRLRRDKLTAAPPHLRLAQRASKQVLWGFIPPKLIYESGSFFNISLKKEHWKYPSALFFFLFCFLLYFGTFFYYLNALYNRAINAEKTSLAKMLPNKET